MTKSSWVAEFVWVLVLLRPEAASRARAIALTEWAKNLEPDPAKAAEHWWAATYPP